MRIYAIGDLHLSFDARIKKPMDIFGGGWINHAGRVKEKWESTVEDGDIVILAGDTSWGLTREEALADFKWIHNLPGKKVIIKGNHDLWWKSITKLNMLYGDITFLQNHCFMADGKTAICGSRGWICPGTEGFDGHDRKIYERELLRLRFSLGEAKKNNAEYIIGALHYPPANERSLRSGFTCLLSEYGAKTCVYGHLHGEESFKNGIKGTLDGVKYSLVSLDYLNAKPKLIYTAE